jgi:hypothetical protein
VEDGFEGEFLVLDDRSIGWREEEGTAFDRDVHSEPKDLCCRKMAGLGYDGWVEAFGWKPKVFKRNTCSSFSLLYPPF